MRFKHLYILATLAGAVVLWYGYRFSVPRAGIEVESDQIAAATPVSSKGAQNRPQGESAGLPDEISVPTAPADAPAIIFDQNSSLREIIDKHGAFARTQPALAQVLGRALFSCYVRDSIVKNGEREGETILLSSQKNCAGITHEESLQFFDFLEAAALAGNPSAQVDFVRLGAARFSTADDAIRYADELLRYKRQAMDFLRSAGRTGDPDAFMQLGLEYQNGRLTEPDPVRVAAAYSVANRLKPSTTLSRMIQTRLDQMSAEQRAVAQAQADAMFNECCLNRRGGG